MVALPKLVPRLCLRGELLAAIPRLWWGTLGSTFAASSYARVFVSVLVSSGGILPALSRSDSVLTAGIGMFEGPKGATSRDRIVR